MSSSKEALIAALDDIEAGYRTVAAFPIETLSRGDGRALLARLDKLDRKFAALQKRLNGRLITMSRMSA